MLLHVRDILQIPALAIQLRRNSWSKENLKRLFWFHPHKNNILYLSFIIALREDHQNKLNGGVAHSSRTYGTIFSTTVRHCVSQHWSSAVPDRSGRMSGMSDFSWSKPIKAPLPIRKVWWYQGQQGDRDLYMRMYTHTSTYTHTHTYVRTQARTDTHTHSIVLTFHICAKVSFCVFVSGEKHWQKPDPESHVSSGRVLEARLQKEDPSPPSHLPHPLPWPHTWHYSGSCVQIQGGSEQCL